MRNTRIAILVIALTTSSMAWGNSGDGGTIPDCTVPEGTLLPDLMTIVPKHIKLHNKQQQEILRFTNGIANIGNGLWWVEPLFPTEGLAEDQTQKAVQVFASDATVVDEVPLAVGPNVTGKCLKGEFEFHPTHNHWHMTDVARYKICDQASFDAAYAAGTPDACNHYGRAATKVTFCLIDWYKLADNSTNSDPTRNFFDCETSFQGVSPGWVDQYHHSLDDQDLIITDIPVGDYVLVTTANHNGVYEETDPSNNTSWTNLSVSRESNGNPKITVTGNACDDTAYYAYLQQTVMNFAPGDAAYQAEVLSDLCGNHTANR